MIPVWIKLTPKLVSIVHVNVMKKPIILYVDQILKLKHCKEIFLNKRKNIKTKNLWGSLWSYIQLASYGLQFPWKHLLSPPFSSQYCFGGCAVCGGWGFTRRSKALGGMLRGVQQHSPPCLVSAACSTVVKKQGVQSSVPVALKSPAYCLILMGCIISNCELK